MFECAIPAVRATPRPWVPHDSRVLGEKASRRPGSGCLAGMANRFARRRRRVRRRGSRSRPKVTQRFHPGLPERSPYQPNSTSHQLSWRWKLLRSRSGRFVKRFFVADVELVDKPVQIAASNAEGASTFSLPPSTSAQCAKQKAALELPNFL